MLLHPHPSVIKTCREDNASDENLGSVCFLATQMVICGRHDTLHHEGSNGSGGWEMPTFCCMFWCCCPFFFLTDICLTCELCSLALKSKLLSQIKRPSV
jgi:hypothetical protein